MLFYYLTILNGSLLLRYTFFFLNNYFTFIFVVMKLIFISQYISPCGFLTYCAPSGLTYYAPSGLTYYAPSGLTYYAPFRADVLRPFRAQVLRPYWVGRMEGFMVVRSRKHKSSCQVVMNLALKGRNTRSMGEAHT